VPFLSFFFRDARKAAEITASLRLDVPQIAFLIGATDEEGEEKAKGIYQDAYAIPVRKGEERVTGKKGVVKAEVEVDKSLIRSGRGRELIETEGVEREEVEGREVEEEEKETKKQKSLTDFF
jgi:hypothetical protein